jgi:hypothetical protein
LAGWVGLTDKFGVPDEFNLTSDVQKAGQAVLIDVQMNGLLQTIHAARWGIEQVLRKAEENGLSRQDLLSWSPDPDIKEEAVTSGFKADWMNEMPEYLVEGRLPTLGQMVNLMDDTIKRYQTSRLRSLGVYTDRKTPQHATPEFEI